MAADPASPADQTVVQAATVIVFRNGGEGPFELLMVRRSKALSFAASAAVFPGGKVNLADLRLAGGDEELGARIAAVRETLEETGLVIGTAQKPSAQDAIEARRMLAAQENLEPVLRRFSWTLALEQLTPFARWLPNFKPGRIFDTRFYLTNVGTGAVELAPDLGENTHLFWVAAQDALDQIEQGTLQAIYPTRRNLERLAQFRSFAEAADHAASTKQETISPWIEAGADGKILCIPEGLGYPVTAAPISQIRLD